VKVKQLFEDQMGNIVAVNCKKCGHRYIVKNTKKGQVSKCPKCGHTITFRHDHLK
jgi:predicted Zn finger-like uncharacterized protein